MSEREDELEEVERTIAILERHIHEEPIDPWAWRKLCRLSTPVALRALRARRDALMETEE